MTETIFGEKCKTYAAAHHQGATSGDLVVHLCYSV